MLESIVPVVVCLRNDEACINPEDGMCTHIGTCMLITARSVAARLGQCYEMLSQQGIYFTPTLQGLSGQAPLMGQLIKGANWNGTST